MCDDAVRGDPFSLQFVPDWFVTQQLIELWDDDDTIAMMMRLLNGMKVIKTGRPRKQE